MNNVNLLLSQNPSFKFIAVKFTSSARPGLPAEESSKPYMYKTTLDVGVDDLVVVYTPSGEYKVVRVSAVSELHEVDNSYEYKWVVSKVDTDYYEDCKAKESEVKKQMNHYMFEKQREEYRAQLEERLGKDAVISLEGLVKL